MVDARDKRHDVLTQGRGPDEEKNHVLGGDPRASERMEPTESGARLPNPGEVAGNKMPPMNVTGLEALSRRLNHVKFPATREYIVELVERIGLARIPIDKASTRSVTDIMQMVAPNTFRSHVEVESAVKQVWDRIQTRSGDGRGSHHGQRDDLTGQKRNEGARQ